MPNVNAERLKSYIHLIGGKRKLEELRESVPVAGASPLESFAIPGTQSGLAVTDGMELAQAARTGLDQMLIGNEPSSEQLAGLEAIIIPELRPAIDIVGGKFRADHQLWTHLSTDAAIRARIEKVIPSVGRIELPNNPQYPYGGTGFVVGKNLLMTNRHVAAIFANGLGSRSLAIKPRHKAGIDFVRERGGGEGTTLLVRRVVLIHPYWDMAVLEVENLPADHKPLTLSVADVSGLDGREIVIIGYPAFDPRNNAAEQDTLMDRLYGVKRLQPGQLHGRAETESFGKMVSAAAHDCSTLGGNSGSGVIDVATGEIVGLHFGGRYHDKNFAVPAFELARDSRVVDAGINFGRGAPGGVPPWSDWWDKADLVEAVDPDSDGTGVQRLSSGGTAAASVQGADGDSVTFQIPIQITVRLGAVSTVVATAGVARTEAVDDGGLGITEGLVEPWRDTRYQSRTGYDENFLGVPVPMPQPADPSVLAPTLQGGKVLHYENFSIIMHAARRLALVAASNVTADPRLKKPDPNEKYTRKALTGLGENDQEKWFIDPRMDEKYQLPDIFFTKDRKAFDKGHIIRREDVAWGTTYAKLRRANGDTYHVTNCSPQTMQFNRSGSGVENWGDLENQVLSSAAREKLVLFAGPVLDPSDTVFHGAGGGGRVILAKTPARFWKVVVANVEEGLAAFGFVLEQDLSNVAFTEYVPALEFVSHMYPLKDIGEMTGVKFPAAMLAADQYETVRGSEVSIRSNARRRRRRSQA